MANVIVSISVPDDSQAAEILRQWKKEGVNVSAKVGMLIEEQWTVHIDNDALRDRIERVMNIWATLPHRVGFCTDCFVKVHTYAGKKGIGVDEQ